MEAIQRRIFVVTVNGDMLDAFVFEVLDKIDGEEAFADFPSICYSDPRNTAYRQPAAGLHDQKIILKIAADAPFFIQDISLTFR